MNASSRQGISRKHVADVLAVAAVIVLATAIAAYSTRSGTAPASSSSLASSKSSSSTTSSLPSSTLSTSSGTGLCATAVESTPFAFKLQADSQSPALLCVQIYYYNQTSTLTLNPLNEVSILGMKTYPNGTNAVFNARSNFTMTSSAATITIGGQENQNEGAAVIFSITPNQGTSGKFGLNLGWLLPGKTQCNEEFVLLVGNGLPDYTYSTLCSMISGGSGGSASYPSGYIFTEITGATNSTQ